MPMLTAIPCPLSQLKRLYGGCYGLPLVSVQQVKATVHIRIADAPLPGLVRCKCICNE
jgi:hypothetical protein